jgi:hypothetical protein
MHPRSVFRPVVCELLEDRTLPSHSGLPNLTVGALGDSYSDEYQFYPPNQSQARNWVEVLDATQPRVHFGPFTTQDQGEPRHQGFAFNWARGGATSDDMVRNQLPGLAAQVHAGQVKYVDIFIGSNDFSNFLIDVAHGQIKLSQAMARLSRIEARAERNFLAAVNRLLAANPQVKIVVTTMFDLSLLPQIAELRNPAARSLFGAVSEAIGRFNATVRSTATGNARVTLVDLAGMVADWAHQADAAGMVPFGSMAINWSHTGNEFHHFWVADGVHFGTVAQGAIANAFIDAVDAAFGAKLTELAPSQIIRFARHVPSGTP